MNFYQDTKRYERLADELDKVKYTCKCGHRVIIKDKESKTLCSWCNNYVFKSKKDEDLYRIQEKLKRR